MKTTPWIYALLASALLFPALAPGREAASPAPDQRTSEPLLAFRLVEVEPGEGLTQVTEEGSGRTYYMHPEVPLTDKDVDSASVVQSANGPAVELLFSKTGARKFKQVTASSLNRHLGIFVKGKLVSAPVIRDTIAGGKALIQGGFTPEEARKLAQALNK